MSFLSKDEFLELAKLDPEKLYELISKRFDALEARIKELEARLNQNSKNSSKPPSSDQFKKAHESRKTSLKSSGGQKGHFGSNLKKISTPDEIKPYPAPANCENCGESLAEVPAKLSKGQEYNLPKIKIHVIEHQIESKLCGCGHCNIADNAPKLRNNAYYGDEFRALILYLKNQQMLPYFRTKQLIQEVLNHEISEGTFWNIEKEFSELLKPTEEIIKQKIIDSKCAGFDESGTRAMNNNFWVHTAVTEYFSHFSFHAKRGLEGIKNAGILEKFKGVAVHDFFKPYLKLLCEHAFCNAHILRELIGAFENTEQVWANMMIEVLMSALNTKIKSSPIAPNQSAIDEILILYDKAILKGHEENPDTDIGKRKKRSKELNLLNRLEKHKTDIMRFLSFPSVPFDNNLAERALRMIKVKNKISGCFRSPEGAEYFCRVRSFFDTCRKQNLRIYDSIVAIFRSHHFSFATE